MAQSKSEEKRVEAMQADAPKAKFKYTCPACSGVAIETSNKMLNVDVDCQTCGKRITLDNAENYIAL